MMRRLFIVSTAVFWLAVAALWSSALWRPEEPAAPAPVPAATDKTYSPAELARHASADDCWMAIGGQVYDFTAYLPQHPADDALMLAWCGKEASEAYRTKTRGRAHSPRADQLLPKYRVGVLVESR